jgi:hypothetical protein
VKQSSFKGLVDQLESCLTEAGFDAEVTESSHQIILAGRKGEGKSEITVVTQISDRALTPPRAGRIPADVLRSHVSEIAIRPTLGERSRARLA